MHQLLPSIASGSNNFAELILRHAEQQPWVSALIAPAPTAPADAPAVVSLSFGEFGQRVMAARQQLLALGQRSGDRVVVMHAPCIELYILIVALFAEGMVPVFIDTGMGPKRMFAALQLSRAQLLVTSPRLARIASHLPMLARRNWQPLQQLTPQPTPQAAVTLIPQAVRRLRRDAPGLISYTSGTTGQPKGADRTHQSLIAQHQAIRAHWPDQIGDIDMTCLPVLVLHNLCCGMPTVLPDMVFSAPGEVNGTTLLQQIAAQGVTRLSGAPAFMQRLAKAASVQGAPACLRSIRVGGAPVGSKLATRLCQAFPQASIAIIYGSTEAEPMAHIDAEELIALLRQQPDLGFPVGRAVPQAQVILSALPAGVVTADQVQAFAVPAGKAGELLVAGPHVLRGYVDNPQATAENKIPREDGLVWHRTGDWVMRDTHGILWLQGRSADRIFYAGKSLPLFALERRLLDSPGIAQAALVQSEVTHQLSLFLSLEPSANKQCLAGIRPMLQDYGIAACPITLLPSLPVDSRHNSKIQRAALRARAAGWRGFFRRLGRRY